LRIPVKSGRPAIKERSSPGTFHIPFRHAGSDLRAFYLLFETAQTAWAHLVLRLFPTALGAADKTRTDSMKQSLAILAIAAALAAAGTAQAADHEIRMLNRGEKGTMVFEPAFVEAQPGDTIHFIAADKGHNAETIKGMLPDGVEGFKGKINQDIAYQVEAEGIYGIKCAPHYGMGMVAIIRVGEPVNAAEAQAVRHPGRAAAVMGELLGMAVAAN